MSDVATLILQPQTKPKSLAKVNLLIVGKSHSDLASIVNVLKKARVEFTYKYVSEEMVNSSVLKTYDAILYQYYRSLGVESPLEQLGWWYESKQKIPLVLITETLGDELAVECIQAGISGYVLSHKLSKLPDILHNCLLNFDNKKQQELNFESLSQKALQKLKQDKQQLDSESNDFDKAEYISYLTHELRAPLTGILGFSRVLIEQIFGSLNPKQLQYIDAIAESGEHLLELVNDFLDIFKIDADREILYPETFPVEDVCRASMSMLQEKAREKGIEFNLVIGDRVDFCCADRRRLKQILVNLLSNAIKFTEVGSVTLKVSLQEQNIVFSIIDTGIGIADGDREKLFQPFQQIKNNLHNKYKGTGLGLALSLRLARLHDGDIIVVSEINKGSCFSLYLPVRAE
jgi:signal transduction histidine kinase